MANTGYKQATIAYKVSKPDGLPVDVNGQLTSISGRKQAIALLTGHINPDVSKYEIEFFYDKNGVILGVPTITYDVQSCPVGYIRVTPSHIVLEDPNNSASFTLESSNSWRMIKGPTEYISIDFTEGSAGVYEIAVKGLNIGQGYFTFQNVATLQNVSIYVAYVADKPWILEDATWNMLGFWYDNGIWKFKE